MIPWPRRIDPGLYDRRPVDPAAPVHLRFLGTAGFVLRHAQRTLVLDPFLSRPGLLRTAFAPLVPDEARIRREIPQAHEVLVGHSHHDHVLDAPTLCHQTGARLVGSSDTIHVGRAAGLPEAQLVETSGREPIACGPATVRGLPSRHGRVYFNRVTLPGRITAPPPWPPRLRDLPHGLVLSWHIEIGGLRVVHIDTADLIDEELADLGADVLCLCAIGRRYRPGYVETALRLLRPRIVIPCHWDWFFTPYEAHPRLLPGVDLPGFLDEIRHHGAEPVLLPFDGELSLSV